MNSYELSKAFWDWAFDNPEKINPSHAAIYFFAVEHCNRLGWKQKFGFPSQMTMDAIGIVKHSTYIKYFNDLVNWGFFELIQKSSNQYSANIIRLTSGLPKNSKALSKAVAKHGEKQTESKGQSTGSIDKPITIKPKTDRIDDRKLKFASTLKPFVEKYGKEMIREFYEYWTEPNKSNTKFRQELEKTWSLERRLDKWASNQKSFETKKPSQITWE